MPSLAIDADSLGYLLDWTLTMLSLFPGEVYDLGSRYRVMTVSTCSLVAESSRTTPPREGQGENPEGPQEKA